MPRVFNLMALAVLAELVSVSPAFAQMARRGHVAGIFGAYHVDSDHVDGTSPSFGLAAGIRLSSRWDAEVEVVGSSGRLFRQYTGKSPSFAPPGSSFEEFERLAATSEYSYDRRVLSTVSGGFVFRARPRGRWTPLFYAGITNHHVIDVSRVVPIAFPEGVDPDKLARVVPQEGRMVRNLGALTGGVGMSLALTPRLSFVPDVRIDYGSIGDEIENAIRPSIRVMWSY